MARKVLPPKPGPARRAGQPHAEAFKAAFAALQADPAAEAALARVRGPPDPQVGDAGGGPAGRRPDRTGPPRRRAGSGWCSVNSGDGFHPRWRANALQALGDDGLQRSARASRLPHRPSVAADAPTPDPGELLESSPPDGRPTTVATLFPGGRPDPILPLPARPTWACS